MNLGALDLVELSCIFLLYDIHSVRMCLVLHMHDRNTTLVDGNTRLKNVRVTVINRMKTRSYLQYAL